MVLSILLAVVCLLSGAALGWWMAQGRSAAEMHLARRERESREAEVSRLQQEAGIREMALGETRTALAAARERAAGLDARMAAEQRAHEEKVAALMQVGAELTTTFQGLAAKALHQNTEQFLHLARTEMTHQKTVAAGELETRRAAIEQMLTPMRESLTRLSEHSTALEVKREGAYAAVLAQIDGMQSAHSELRRETGQLVQALRAPRVRGTWGEMQLRRCVEFSGMVEHASFETQQHMRGEDGAYRPDLVVKLPNGRCLVVDAKTPLDAFLTAADCEDQDERQGHLRAHAGRVKKHLDDLAGKAYWRQFRESPDFVVCFLPSEVLFSAALEHDTALLEHSAKSKVILASPTTLITLLKTVAYGWQQTNIARDAEMIRQAAVSVHDKLAGMHASMLTLGKSLRKAGDSYDEMLAKAEGRGGLFSITRKLRELEIGQGELAESKPVAIRPRVMESEDWQDGLSLAAVSEQGSSGPLF